MVLSMNAIGVILSARWNRVVFIPRDVAGEHMGFIELPAVPASRCVPPGVSLARGVLCYRDR
jgi:hypothetical protein